MSSDGPFEVTSTKTLAPTDDLIDVLKGNYLLEASIADLVDNAIDAKASKVLIRFLREGERLVSLCVVDNGEGMDAKVIDAAMQVARRRRYGGDQLGMFGVGMKTASLSHAGVLTVLSRAKSAQPVGRQWTVDNIKQKHWACAVLSVRSVRQQLDRKWGHIGVPRTGTIIRWDEVDEFNRLGKGTDAFLQKSIAAIRRYLGLYFHRFLQRGQIDIQIDAEDVATGIVGFPNAIESINPFPTRSAASGFPKVFEVQLPGRATLCFKAFIWPKKSKDPGYKLNTRGKGVAEYQGFYFYRHDRLIDAGGWKGWLGTAEPHLSLARVAIDIPDRAADIVRVLPTKASVDTNSSFTDAAETARAKDGTTLHDFVREAHQIYRTRGEQKVRSIVAPGAGIPADVRGALVGAGIPLQRGKKIQIEWGRVDGDEFFVVDRDSRTMTLNSRYRRALLGDQRGGATDIPIVRTLLYFLLNSTFERTRDRETERERLAAINMALVKAVALEVRRKNKEPDDAS